jgi:hypothetical protein
MSSKEESERIRRDRTEKYLVDYYQKAGVQKSYTEIAERVRRIQEKSDRQKEGK